MNENQVARQVLDACFTIHRTLGPGMLESIYEKVLVYELSQSGLRIRRQVPIPVIYKGMPIGLGFRADLIVEDLVVVELKSVEYVLPLHKKQELSYLRLLHMKLALLINFNAPLLREGITRVVNHLDDPLDIDRTFKASS